MQQNPELHRLDTTLRRWRTRILAFHDTGVSNGRTEAANLNIKTIKRVGRGFRNFETIGSACCCTAASTAILAPPPESEAAPPP